MTPADDDFIIGLPKAELHLHIEGSLEPEMMFAMAKRNHVSIPFERVEAVRSAYEFSHLQDFLDIYYAGADVLRTEQDFHDLTLAYIARAASDGVAHAEIFFDPQTHTARGIPFDVVMAGLRSGLAAGQAAHGVTHKLILCFLRHLDEESAISTLRTAERWFDDIDGVGLDSSELGHPPAKFKRVFARARSAGLKTVAHAGEEGPPDYVWQALDVLKIDRLDHGNRAMEDPALIRRLADMQIALTICPLSNIRLRVVNDIATHPIGAMLSAGLLATINSDDPAYFGGYIADNYRAVIKARAIGRESLVQLARNSFIGSFLSAEEISAHVMKVDQFAAM